MQGLKLGTLFLAAAATGSAATLFVDSRLRPPSIVETAAPAGESEQIARLQKRLNEERQARIALENYVYQRDSADNGERSGGPEPAEDDEEPAVEMNAANMRPFFNQRMEEMMRRRQRANVKQRLVDSGFGEDEAERLLQRQAEIELARLYDDYDERRAQALESPPRPTTSQQLRNELGDEAYERYLQSLGRPTTVPVRTLLQPSPGATAGLQPGDRVLAYNGERVFSMQDLNNLTVQGTPGESVVMEVDRDGRNIAVVIPRGPIGFSSGPFRRR